MVCISGLLHQSVIVLHIAYHFCKSMYILVVDIVMTSTCNIRKKTKPVSARTKSIPLKSSKVWDGLNDANNFLVIILKSCPRNWFAYLVCYIFSCFDMLN